VDSGQLIYIISRLILGAVAAFFAIVLWSKTRDPAWMLMAAASIAAYAGTVYSILRLFGITGTEAPLIGSVPLLAIILPNLPTIFFLSAFLVMIIRNYREH
jgi:uncharacterized membrane protein YccC